MITAEPLQEMQHEAEFLKKKIRILKNSLHQDNLDDKSKAVVTETLKQSEDQLYTVNQMIGDFIA